MNIKLSCAKAWERLKGGYKLYSASKRVKIYIPNGTHKNISGKTMSLGELVYILCNGTDKIPPRNFLVDVPRHLRHEVFKMLKERTNVILRNTTNINDLGEIYTNFNAEDISMEVTSLVKKCITDGFYASSIPNAPRTVRNKGFNLPLVHTGALVNSISAKIEDKDD